VGSPLAFLALEFGAAPAAMTQAPNLTRDRLGHVDGAGELARPQMGGCHVRAAYDVAGWMAARRQRSRTA
jgi:hypothetical protein